VLGPFFAAASSIRTDQLLRTASFELVAESDFWQELPHLVPLLAPSYLAEFVGQEPICFEPACSRSSRELLPSEAAAAAAERLHLELPPFVCRSGQPLTGVRPSTPRCRTTGRKSQRGRLRGTLTRIRRRKRDFS